MLDQLQAILEDLTSGDRKVRGAIIVSNDGLTMASTFEDDDGGATAAIAAAVFDRTDRISRRMDLGSNEETALIGDLSSYMMVRAGHESILIVQAETDALLGLVRHRAQSAADRISGVLDGSV